MIVLLIVLKFISSIPS